MVFNLNEEADIHHEVVMISDFHWMINVAKIINGDNIIAKSTDILYLNVFCKIQYKL